jgi:tetratricopeptide (TPR) repeat protein
VLRGDLETIILKAIERDPALRYQSAAALADDLHRFLTNQPIQARPAGFMYLARKLVARHRLAFGAAATVLVVSLTAGAISTASLVQARAAARSADNERQVAETVTRFLADTFSHIDPRLAKRRDTTLLSELLAGAVQRTESELADQPEVRARLDGVFGNAFLSLGLYEQAEPHLVRALSLCRATLGGDHPETLAAMNNLGTLRSDQSRLDEATKLYETTLEARRRILGQEHRDTVTSMNNLGDLYRQTDRLPEAEKLLQETLELRRRLLGNEHAETLVTMNNLAGVWILQRKTRQAEDLLRECLGGQIKTLGEDHLDVLVSKSDLSIVLGHHGKSDEAATMLREVVDGFTRELGAGHMDTLIARYNLAAQERKRQAPDQAVEAMERLTADADGYLPAGHHLLGSIRSTLARRMFDLGRFAEAEPHAVRAFNELESSLGQSHMTTRAAADTVADIYEALKQPDRAAPYRTLSDGK